MGDRPVTSFSIQRPKFSRHFNISNEKGSLYGDISRFTPDKPDLTVHNGSSNKDPAIAMCHFNKFSFEMKMGLGDPANPATVIWEGLHRTGVSTGEYEFQFTLPSGERKMFTWKRTRHNFIPGKSTSNFGRKNMKLVEGRDGPIVALFTTDGMFSNSGTLNISVAYGQQFDMFALLGLMTIYEKNMRRKKQAGVIGATSAGG